MSSVLRSRCRGRPGSKLDRSVRQQPHAKPRHRADQQNECGGKRQIEPGVEIDHDARRVGVELRERRHHQIDQRQDSQTADQLEAEVADRHPARRRLVGQRRHHRRDGAAQVGAEHQDAGNRQRQHARARQRHDQQHGRQAGMGEPGQKRRDQNADQRLVDQRAEQLPHDVRLADRRRRGEEQAQRQEHQAEPDGHPAHFPIGRSLGAEIYRHPEQDHDRASHCTSRERTWATSVVPMSAPSITASAGAVSTRPRPANEATTRAVAVLLCRMPVTPMPARSAAKRLLSETRSVTQLGAKGPLHAVRTMRVPQQQRRRAEQFDQDVVCRGLVH